MELTHTYAENYQDLIGYAGSLTGSMEVAQDIVQQVFANTLTSISHGVEIRTMGGFLYRCVHNLAVNHAAREKQPALLEDASHPTVESAASSADRRRNWLQIKRTLDRLPASQRSAFLLAEVRGLKYEEIAEVLNRSTASVRQLLHRARSKVREDTDQGSDWAMGPLPVLLDKAEIGYRIRGGQGSSISTWLWERAFDVHGWLVSIQQSSVEHVLQPSTTAVAATVVTAIVAVSPTLPKGTTFDEGEVESNNIALAQPQHMMASNKPVGHATLTDLRGRVDLHVNRKQKIINSQLHSRAPKRKSNITPLDRTGLGPRSQDKTADTVRATVADATAGRISLPQGAPAQDGQPQEQAGCTGCTGPSGQGTGRRESDTVSTGSTSPGDGSSKLMREIYTGGVYTDEEEPSIGEEGPQEDTGQSFVKAG